MGERRGTKGLELWCRRMTEGYPGVKIDNMTTSWRDGLAFCAIIHHFRPDLIDFSKLNKDAIYHNNELAFRIAEHHLGIPALLEPEDMVECQVPDRLSILTYLSQFYQAFGSPGTAATRIPAKRLQTNTEHNIVSPASTSPPTKIAYHGKVRREPCAKCGLPVFIAERLNVGKHLYHRTCFRCARCDSQLTLANYYETESNEFCCETCPDEEKSISSVDSPEKSLLSRSMSDEQKTALVNLNYNEQSDDYSWQFESALENPEDESLKRNATLTSERSKFFQSQYADAKEQNDSDSGTEEEPPDLPKTKPPSMDQISSNDNSESLASSSAFDSGFPIIKQDSSVHIVSSNINISKQIEQSEASEKLDENIVTKDVEEENNVSLVKSRMRLFETNAKSDEVVKPPVPLVLPNDSQTCIPLVDNSNEHAEDDILTISSDAKDSVQIIDDSVQIIDDSVIVIDDSIDSDSNVEVVPSKEESIVPPNDEIKDSSVKVEVSVETASKGIEVELKGEKNDSVESEVEAIQPQIVPKPRKKKLAKEESYPEELNPFGDDDDNSNVMNISTGSLNPFGDDDSEEEIMKKPIPSPRIRRKIQVENKDKLVGTPNSQIYLQRISVNPFEENEDEEKVESKPPLPVSRNKKVLEAPRISLNPFWSDGEEQDEESSSKLPLPKPRYPRTKCESVVGTAGGSLSSLSSGNSTGTHTITRKKKPAPKPPGLQHETESAHSSLTSSPSQSTHHSPRLTPKNRKSKRAPLPPGTTSTPKDTDSLNTTDISENVDDDCEKEKIAKDELNRNKQSQNLAFQSPISSETSSSSSVPNKSTYGKWKRRKGQAPTRPIPQRRTIKALPMAEIRRELEVIEIQQQGLEKQGVVIEQLIREKSENTSSPDEAVTPEVEDLILQLFELVNEKNELFRKQAELMYLRRQQRLEEEHADVEYQIRCLMLQPEANKTDSDKAREEELINRLVDIVERRNEIIECLEMDRVREAQEDDSINNQLNLYTMKREDKNEMLKPKKEKKKHKITKEKIKEKLHILKDKDKDRKIDVDKDVDESETPSLSSTLEKDKEKKKKKKFNIFLK